MADMFGNICTCRKCNGIVHTIKKGDTLYQLSRYYNVTINEIMRANANVNVYNLQVGDQICIPTRRPMPMPVPMPIPGPNKPQPPTPGRPSVIQPRSMEVDEDGESNQEFIETSSDSVYEEIESEPVCCGSSMKVKDLLNSEDMTLEDLASMLKNL